MDAAPDRNRKFLFWLFAIFAVLALAGICAGGLYLISRQTSNAYIVTNNSQKPLQNLRLKVVDMNQKPLYDQTRTTLYPGESWILKTSVHDSRATLTFELDLQPYSYDEPYIDFWTGEGWEFSVQSDGSVQTHYSRNFE